MAKLLLIGGTGFFGKSILDAFQRNLLLDFGVDQITIIARNKQRFLNEYSNLITHNVEIIEGDINYINLLPEADIIIYAAASTNTQDYKKNGFQELLKMKNGILNFCELIKKFGDDSKIVFCSSGAVYGKQPISLEKIDETYPFENDLSGISEEKIWYLQGKRFAEEQIYKLGEFNKNVSIARCFAFSGKYLPKDQHYAIGNFIGQAEKGKNIQVEAPGVVFRSYMKADELVKSLFQIAKVASPKCPIFNVGSDIQISIYDLAESIAKKYNVQCEFKNLNREIVIDRYVPNVDKLKSLFV